MTAVDVRTQLETLLDLLRQERECAMALDMQGLQAVVENKEALLAGLTLEREDVVGMEDLLRKIDNENRRNAFLLWTGLNWVRDLMGFFGKAAIAAGLWTERQFQDPDEQGGRLLSGKV